MTMALKALMMQTGIAVHIIGAFVPQVGAVQVVRGEARIALLEITIDNALGSWGESRTCVCGRHRRRSYCHGTHGG